MKGLKEICSKLPDEIKVQLLNLPENVRENVCEIRFRTGKQPTVKAGDKIYTLEAGSIGISRDIMDKILNSILDFSIYSYEDDIARGFITIEGGHRVGVCGTGVIKNGQIVLLKNISSINIRRSREIIGASSKVMEYILNSDSLHNTVIVSPPGCGKTTMLRDIVRQLSCRGFTIGLCDERSEIAGMYNGMASFDLGPSTDVLDGCCKADAMIMLLRSMAPDVIVTDEIGTAEDCSAIEQAVISGVKIITSIHGSTFDEISRSKIGHLLENRTFRRVIFLTGDPVPGTIKEVVNV